MRRAFGPIECVNEERFAAIAVHQSNSTGQLMRLITAHNVIHVASCTTCLDNNYARSLSGRKIVGRHRAKEEKLELTERERQILELVGNGLQNKEIARQLGLSDLTVKTHMHNIFVKVKAGGRLKTFIARHHEIYSQGRNGIPFERDELSGADAPPGSQETV